MQLPMLLPSLALLFPIALAAQVAAPPQAPVPAPIPAPIPTPVSMPAAAPAAPDWDAVKRLPVTTLIRVSSRNSSGKTCEVVKVEDEMLTCNYRHVVFFLPQNERVFLPRKEVLTVRRSLIGWSTLAGALLGAAAGAAVGAGLDTGAPFNPNHYFLYLLALIGGSVGSGIGQRTDFVKGPLVYQAP